MRQIKAYLKLQPCVHLMTAKELISAQAGLNRIFIKHRDSGAIIDGVYRRLKQVEAELNKRRIQW